MTPSRSGRQLAGLAALAATLAACGDDVDTAATPTRPPLSRAEELIAKLDCEKHTSADPTFENSRWSFDESIDCWVNGRPSIRIHTFDPKYANGTVASFNQRYGEEAGLVPCPDGTESSDQYVIADNDWAAVVTSTDLRDFVMDRLGGDYLEGDDTTPVSYAAVDPCPNESPTSAG